VLGGQILTSGVDNALAPLFGCLSSPATKLFSLTFFKALQSDGAVLANQLCHIVITVVPQLVEGGIPNLDVFALAKSTVPPTHY